MLIDMAGRATQAALADLVGVTQPTISNLMAEGKLPATGTLGELLHAYCQRLRDQAAGRLGSELGGLDLVQERAALAREQREGQLFLAGIKLVISSLLFQQLIVIAALDDFAVFQYHDRIRVSNSGKPVGDDKGCPFCHQAIHTMLNMSLGSRIDRGRCLIQDQDRRLGNCRTGTV